MEKGKDVLKRHSADRKEQKVLKRKKFECASMASSSNSEGPEDETLSSNLNGEEQKNTVIGQGGNGLTNINNSNSNITFNFENVQITEINYCGDPRRIDLDVCKDTRGDIPPPSKLFGETTTMRNMDKIYDFIASSSNSVLGMSGIGLTNNNNSNSNFTVTFENVQITVNNYFGDTRRIRGDILFTSKLFGETTAKRKLEEIWGLIIGDVKKIGVYGMGGIGKTTVMKHIHNRILEAENNKFDSVIWVTVSQVSSVFKLQHDIACKIDVNLSKYKDTPTRARKLNKALKQNGRYLLILDDLWEGYPLEDVGIPDPDDPTSSNICKLVLTTRSLDVCRRMKCKTINMDLLSEDEAWRLLLDHVGLDVSCIKDLEPIVKDVALECGGLPLAVATIGISMKGKKETFEWRYALAKLKAFSKEPGDEGRRVIE